MSKIRAKRNLAGNIALVVFLAFLVTLTLGINPGPAQATPTPNVSVSGTSGTGTAQDPVKVTTDSLTSLPIKIQIAPLTPSDFGNVLLSVYQGTYLKGSISVYDLYKSAVFSVYETGYQIVYNWTGLNLDYGTNSGYTLVKTYSGGNRQEIYLTIEGPPRPSSGGGGGSSPTTPATSTTTTTTVSNGDLQAGGTTVIKTGTSGATATLTVDGKSVNAQVNNAGVSAVQITVPATVAANGNQVPVNQAVLEIPADTVSTIFNAEKPIEMQLGNVVLGLPPGSIDLSAFADQGVTLAFDVAKASENSVPAPGTSAYKIAGQVYHISIRAIKNGVDVGGISNLSKPITLTLPYDGSGDAGIFRLNETSKVWEPMGGTVNQAAGTISVTRTSLSIYAVMTYTKAFSDTKGHWAKESIYQLVAKGAINGYPDGTFKPDQSITRAEFAAILVKAFGLQTQSGKLFDDTANHWAKDYIATAAANGIVKGYSDKKFGPDDLITREQMAVMVSNAAKLGSGSGSTSFTDNAQISDWAKSAVSVAGEKNIISGYPDNSFKPKANATRAEATTVIVKAIK